MQQGHIDTQQIIYRDERLSFDFSAENLRLVGVIQREVSGGGALREILRDDIVLVVVIERLDVDLKSIIEQPIFAAQRIGSEFLRLEIRQQSHRGAEIEAAFEIAGRYVRVQQRRRCDIGVDSHLPVNVMPGIVEVVWNISDREIQRRNENLILTV